MLVDPPLSHHSLSCFFCQVSIPTNLVSAAPARLAEHFQALDTSVETGGLQDLHVQFEILQITCVPIRAYIQPLGQYISNHWAHSVPEWVTEQGICSNPDAIQHQRQNSSAQSSQRRCIYMC
jgi:hypothetical protein